MRLLRWLQDRLALYPRRTIGKDALDSLIERGVSRVRSVDPETHVQWLRLQRALSAAPVAKARTRVQWIPRLAILAMIVAAILAGVYFYFALTHGEAETFVTGKGEQLRVVLADSTEVLLNYATELNVPKFRPGQPRRLTLSGEAYFRVRHNTTPFIVSTDVAEVQVTGTEFNVRVREGVAEIAVLHGAIAVSAQNSTVDVAAHQMVVCSEGGLPYHAGTVPSPEYPGWMSGKMFLNRASFASACNELELRFDIEIRLDDPSLYDERISGVLDVRTPQSALTALCELAGKNFSHDGQVYHIY